MTFEIEFIKECRIRLLEEKAKILNQLTTIYHEFATRETTGDEADQSVSNILESQFLTTSNRLRNQLLEIELALLRIQNGRFGVCEETQEFIEQERLRAIPWTRLSIEGAEIREAMNKKFA